MDEFKLFHILRNKDMWKSLTIIITLNEDDLAVIKGIVSLASLVIL